MNSEDILKAGKIAGQVRDYGASLIKSGASYMAIYNAIRDKIQELGAKPAFPPQMALNDVAAHFLPELGKDIVLSDEVVSLDVGVEVNGAIGDTAITIDLSNNYQKLNAAVQKALQNALDTIKVGVELKEVGKVIEKTIADEGFESVKNLSGHGLGLYQIHTKPSIPNYDNGSTLTFEPNMHFAVEPFATTGKGLIYDAGNPTIFTLTGKKPVRSLFTREVLKVMEKYNGLPFSVHDLQKAGLAPFKIAFAIKELSLLGVLVDHGALVEEKHGIVVQAEHTVYIDASGTVHITTRNNTD